MNRKPGNPAAVRVIAAALLLGVGACGPVPRDEGRLPQEEAPIPVVETEPAGADASSDVSSDVSPAADAAEPLPEVALKPTEPGDHAVPPPEVIPDPVDLLGLDRAAVSALLGKPDFLRRDPPAELWQYRNHACILDFFLYRQENGDDYTVAHFEARGTSVFKVSAKDCLRHLLTARHP